MKLILIPPLFVIFFGCAHKQAKSPVIHSENIPTQNSSYLNNNIKRDWFYNVSEYPEKTVSAELVSAFPPSMTLKQLVTKFGPGWMSPNEGCGIVAWFTDDGRALRVWPNSYLPDTVVKIHIEKTTQKIIPPNQQMDFTVKTPAEYMEFMFTESHP